MPAPPRPLVNVAPFETSSVVPFVVIPMPSVSTPVWVVVVGGELVRRALRLRHRGQEDSARQRARAKRELKPTAAQ